MPGKFYASLRPPGLVLFETEGRETPILQTGFLILEVFFANAMDAKDSLSRPRLSDLLTMNELFRYWKCPYKGHSLPAEEQNSKSPPLCKRLSGCS